MKTHDAHDLKYTARALRRNMTKEENHVWYDFLKRLPLTVNRQKQLEGFIVDFLIPKAGIVIEIDGSQHYSEEGRTSDIERDMRLCEMGMTVLRYSNHDVNTNFDGLCLDIIKNLNEKGISVGFKDLN